MFGVAGQHTFFFPVDSAFDVSVPLTGYDYERGRPTGLSKMGVSRTGCGILWLSKVASIDQSMEPFATRI